MLSAGRPKCKPHIYHRNSSDIAAVLHCRLYHRLVQHLRSVNDEGLEFITNKTVSNLRLDGERERERDVRERERGLAYRGSAGDGRDLEERERD